MKPFVDEPDTKESLLIHALESMATVTAESIVRPAVPVFERMQGIMCAAIQAMTGKGV